MLGELDEAALLAAADKEDIEPLDEQQCEANYFIGMKRLMQGNKEGAREYLRKAAASSRKDYFECDFARVELARLDVPVDRTLHN
jgi:lipoprotein NlpI